MTRELEWLPTSRCPWFPPLPGKVFPASLSSARRPLKIPVSNFLGAGTPPFAPADWDATAQSAMAPSLGPTRTDLQPPGADLQSKTIFPQKRLAHMQHLPPQFTWFEGWIMGYSFTTDPAWDRHARCGLAACPRRGPCADSLSDRILYSYSVLCTGGQSLSTGTRDDAHRIYPQASIVVIPRWTRL